MNRKALKSSGIDVQGQDPWHESTPQADTSPSSPPPIYSTLDRTSPQHLTSSTAPRRVSPLADLGTLISKSQLNRRISQQPSPPHNKLQKSTGREGQATKTSADQSKSRRATADPSFLSRFLPSQAYGESKPTSNFLDLSPPDTTSNTIIAPAAAITAPAAAITSTPLPKITEPITPAPHPRLPATKPAQLTTFIPPLTLIHFHCYQSHCSMKRSSNVHAPVPCMTCRIDDKEMRWKCTWCCLRICAGCAQKLENVRGKDLNSLVQRLGRGRVRSQGY